MKLARGRRLTGDLDELVAEFTSSISHDVFIVDEVVDINLAHVIALAKGQVISKQDAAQIAKALLEVRGKIELSPELEDVHLAVEQAVLSKLPVDIGGKMHTGKSRNDQVAAALRMRLRRFILDILKAILNLRDALLMQAERHVETLMPGFTHFQPAQPVTLAHHLLAHHDAFARDFKRFLNAYSRVNQSPLGAAALAGADYPIDRNLTAKLLGFDGLVENSMDAVSSRDFALEVMGCLSILMVHASKLAEEFILWSNPNLGYVEIPDAHASTSSIMPQKKNPVSAEVVRARCGHVSGYFSAACSVLKALPLSYNLDFQEVTPLLWESCISSLQSIKVLEGLVRDSIFKTDKLQEDAEADYLTATALANFLVREAGLSFRQAHFAVGEVVRKLLERSISFREAGAKEVTRLLAEITGKKLSPSALEQVLSARRSLDLYRTKGSSSPREVSRMLKARRIQLDGDNKTVSDLEEKLKRAEDELRRLIEELLSS